MRETKELLRIVLDEFENERVTCGHRGICTCIRILWLNSLITQEEMCFLIEFIGEKKPKRGKHFCKLYEPLGYFWEPGLKPPRIAWLKYLIQKTQ